MPSIIQSPATEASATGTFEADYYFPSKADRHSRVDQHSLHDASATADNNKSVQNWYNADDEFGVPIFTKQRLIPEKAPLDSSSFLFHHPTLQRSVEIMIPPGHTPYATNSICPTMPDGPIFIHHRSALPNTPLEQAMHRHRYSQKGERGGLVCECTRDGETCCATLTCIPFCSLLNLPHRPSSRTSQRSWFEMNEQQQQDDSGSFSRSTTTTTTTIPISPSASALEYTFIQNQVDMIGQWLASIEKSS